MSITPSSGFRSAKWIVSPTAGLGTHTTISAALTAASSGDTIQIRSGTYTENPTLKAGVNLVAWPAEDANVIILGKCSFSGTGSVSISGIQLKTNSDYFLSVTGSSASVVTLFDCSFTCSSNTGIQFTSSSSSSVISIQRCSLSTTTTGVAAFSHSAAGNLGISYSSFSSGSSTTASTNSGTGNLNIIYCDMGIPITTSSSSTNSYVYTQFNLASLNITPITYNSTTQGTCDYCNIYSGTASGVSVGAGASLLLISCNITSSNTNVVTGSGTVYYGNLSFPSFGSSNKINTTTQNILDSSCFQSMNVQSFSSSGTYTPTTGMKYCIIECVGGGGAGGGGQTTGASTTSSGGGGGAGEYARQTFYQSSIGTSQTVTIGAAGTGSVGATGGNGGNTSVGALISANGGSGGATSAAATNTLTAGGAGGTGGSGGSIQTKGISGWFGQTSLTPGIVIGGAGGNGPFGAGGPSKVVSGTGNAATGFGAGGGGGSLYSSLSNVAGGDGTKGFVYITEFLG